jgi:RNA polymerase sigma-70 factor (ECF subfamily)
MQPPAPAPAPASAPSPISPADGPEAFARLAEEHGPVLLRVARRLLGNASDAEDAVQTAFVQALQHADGFRPGAEPRPWLIGITLNACRRFRRREGRLAALHRRAAELVRAAAVPLEDDLGLDLALARLGDDERAALWLRYGEGLEFRELAVALRVTQKTAESRVQRALRRLRLRLGGDRHRPLPALALLVAGLGGRAAAGEHAGQRAALADGARLLAAGAAASPLRWPLIGGTLAAAGLSVALLAPGREPWPDDSALPPTVVLPADRLGLRAGIVAPRPGAGAPATSAARLLVTLSIIDGTRDRLRAIGLVRGTRQRWTVSATELALLKQRIARSDDVSLLAQPSLVLEPGMAGTIRQAQQVAYLHDYDLVHGVPDPAIAVLEHGVLQSVIAEPAGAAVRLLALHTVHSAPRGMSVAHVALPTRDHGARDLPVEEPSLLLRQHHLDAPVTLGEDEALVIAPDGFRALVQRGEATRLRQLATAAGVPVRREDGQQAGGDALATGEARDLALVVTARQVEDPPTPPAAVSRR